MRCSPPTRTPGAPPIVRSANASREQQADLLPPQAYLPAPIDVEQLLALVATYQVQRPSLRGQRRNDAARMASTAPRPDRCG